MNRLVAVTGILAALIMQVAAADTLALKNGDRLTGSLVQIADDTLVFRTNLAGQIIVPTGQVQSLSTASEFAIVFKDGTKASGRIASKTDALHVVNANSGKDMKFDIASVVSAAPAPRAIESGGDGEGAAGWQGSVEVGPEYVWGDKDYLALYAKVSLHKEMERYYYDAQLKTELADNGRFPRSLELVQELEFKPQQTIHPYVSLSLERRADQAVELGAQLDVGVRRALIATDRYRVEGELSIGGQYDIYDADDYRALDTGGDGLDRIRAKLYADTLDKHDSESDVIANLGVKYSANWLKHASVAEELHLYPSLTNFGDFRGTSESSVQFPLSERLKLKLNLNLEYDSEPHYDYMDEWRASVGAGIVWDF